MRSRSCALPALLVCLVSCLVLCLGACSSKPPHLAAARILFIGNSYTFINGGIPAQLRALDPTAVTETVAVGGYTLQDHWYANRAVGEIQKGGWTYVVLQEQSQTAVTGQQQFDRYVRMFDYEIRAAGAKTVLLMTWQRPDSLAYGVTTAGEAAAYNQIGSAVGARVAPAGLAFARSLGQRPDLALNIQDGHPTMAGTYLAACVLYGTLFHRSPVGIDAGAIGGKDRTFLQHMAAATLGY
jgi:hypothetical protein